MSRLESLIIWFATPVAIWIIVFCLLGYASANVGRMLLVLGF